jgi:hypothetical protein
MAAIEDDSRYHSVGNNRHWFTYLWRMIRHPILASREITAWQSVTPGLVVAFGFGIYLSAGCYRSYLNHDYPPSADELKTWIATWGEFAMLPLPFLKIPLEQYRLFMAIISLPVVLFSWLYMACAARILSGWFSIQTSFRQYLNLFAFSFFPFWLLASVGDGLFSSIFGSTLMPGLQGEYGPLIQAIYTNYPPLLYTVLFGLAALYNGLAAYGAGQTGKNMTLWQAVVIGLLTFLLPLALVSTLFR